MLFASLVHFGCRCVNQNLRFMVFTFWSLLLTNVATDKAGIGVSVGIDIDIWVRIVRELFFWCFIISAAFLGLWELDFNLGSIDIWIRVCAVRFDDILRVLPIIILFLLPIFWFGCALLLLFLRLLRALLILHYQLRFNQRYKRIVLNQTWQAFVCQRHHILAVGTFDFLGLRIREHESQALCTKAMTTIEHKRHACLRIPIIEADWAFHLI